MSLPVYAIRVGQRSQAFLQLRGIVDGNHQPVGAVRVRGPTVEARIQQVQLLQRQPCQVCRQGKIELAAGVHLGEIRLIGDGRQADAVALGIGHHA